MHAIDFSSVEFQMLWWSVVLGFVQLILAVLASVSARSLPWAMGPRDDAGAPLGKIGARLERANRNFLESFPFFAAVVLLAGILNRHTSLSVLGVQLYFWGRVVYLPLYAFGVPLLRTLAWTVAIIGIVLVLLTI